MDLKVESRYGDDLRDAAPGGIFVPGTNGAATYPDPTQLQGKGSLVEAPLAPDVGPDLGDVTGQPNGPRYH